VWKSTSSGIPCQNTETGKPIVNGEIAAIGSTHVYPDGNMDDIYIYCGNDGTATIIYGVPH
jgi:hypothetical protein